VSTPTNAVELRGVSKSFGTLKANSEVSFAVRKGSIFALVGENGAGKSTCMNLIYGLQRPDQGQIFINGQEHVWSSPRDAIKAGLGMVHQHFMLAAPHSGLDNIILGDEPEAAAAKWLPKWLRPIMRSRAIDKLTKLMASHQLAVNLDAEVNATPVGVQQRLEILKLLFRDAQILILDEPTAVLTPQEAEAFYTNLAHLKEQGKTVIVITHKLSEVLTHADDYAVLRAGRIVASGTTDGLTEQALAEQMVGRAVQLTAAKPTEPQLGAVALSCHQLSLGRKGEKPRLTGIDLTLRSGEILGIAGVEGNGQSELLDLLADPHEYFRRHDARAKLNAHGQLNILGTDVRHMRPAAVRALGVGMVPEDRHRQGLLLDQDLTQNFLLGLAHEPEFSESGIIRSQRVQAKLREAIKEFDIRPASPSALARGLSGGNQQKLILAREFARKPKLLICAQPTRGVDVGAIEFIHERILAARNAGMAILLVSSSLEEILALADRIVVMYEGRLVGECQRGVDEAKLGRLMGGVLD